MEGETHVSKIEKVVPNDDYTLLIELNNRHKIIYDLKPRLKSLRFSSLQDLSKFKAVGVAHENTLVWDSLCEITLDEIINHIER